MGTNDDSSRLAWLAQASETAEFIQLFHSMVAENNQLPEQTLFPLDGDAATDLLYTMLGVWLAMCAPLPLESRAEVAAAMDRMAALLKEMQRDLPEEPEELKRYALHCMRRGVTPDYWPRLK